ASSASVSLRNWCGEDIRLMIFSFGIGKSTLQLIVIPKCSVGAVACGRRPQPRNALEQNVVAPLRFASHGTRAFKINREGAFSWSGPPAGTPGPGGWRPGRRG